MPSKRKPFAVTLSALTVNTDEYAVLECLANKEEATVDEWISRLVKGVAEVNNKTTTLVVLGIPNGIYDAYNEDEDESPQDKICRIVVDEGDKMLDGKKSKAGTGKSRV